MTELTRALAARFSEGAGLPLYLAGWVPPDARPPYLTMDLEEAPPRQTGSLEIRVWMQPHGVRPLTDALDAVAALVPEGGLRLAWTGGLCLVRRARTGFLRLTEAPGRGGGTGGAVRFEITCYAAA
ncbi:MAG: hypothetical protein IKP10_01760 [Clostridia bacterium]|nr:hypothetical protein [Clostridia bacterium]